ncbi:MerR family transcriptional regulator [Lysinibacillus sp. BPa_S21]|uniref:MerR family transcriptional regulator n=1 Tax=Lysinibacillus sp. BPa_S21 TaxID=2932478 RepID=UPI002011663F|nr:MerR family transcriptional regulator [Lysinibacillus sp. BPa_S21]MCL1694524.1 MerR family transcriptional regulator [Lysinibacillus sp. BPa_S21]
MHIKQFAAKYNLSTDTLRYYEKEGLLNPSKQDNGYRVYDVTCEHKIKFILVLKQVGFTLQEIKQLLLLEQKPTSDSCNQETVQLFLAKIAHIEQQLFFYQQALQSLQLTQTLMAEGKYAENKLVIGSLIEDMYNKLQEGSVHHETT